jgi:hypothetical protein
MTTWTPATQQTENWTSEAQNYNPRTFSPYTFSRRPVFDTGPSAGIWDGKAKQAEIWTLEAAP